VISAEYEAMKKSGLSAEGVRQLRDELERLLESTQVVAERLDDMAVNAHIIRALELMRANFSRD
jgi:hypothetical protein